MLTENIIKAQQTAALLASDLLQAHHDACTVERPEGQTIGDKATSAYLIEAIEMARKLEAKLLQL